MKRCRITDRLMTHLIPLSGITLLLLLRPGLLFASLPGDASTTPAVVTEGPAKRTAATRSPGYGRDRDRAPGGVELELVALPSPPDAALSTEEHLRTGSDLFFEGSNFKALTHLVGSHIAILTRPVTASVRLFFMVYDTGKDAVRWTWLSEFDGKPVPPLADSPGMDLTAWEGRLDEITREPASRGRVRLHIDGPEYFPRLFEGIEGARKEIRIRTYIFDNDPFALQVADALKRRSRDVDVRVLLDGLGSIMANKVDPPGPGTGGPRPASVKNYLTHDSDIRVRQQFNTWTAGDHGKTVTIDGRLGFLGGMNIGEEYRYGWHDLMVSLEGPVVRELDHDFGRSWAGAGVFGDIEKMIHGLRPRTGKEGSDLPPVRLLFTRPGDSQIRNAQLEAIRRSRRAIIIENPYIADDGIVYELVKARRRGVDVRVIMPSANNHKSMGSSNILAANALVANGVRVFLFPGMTHVKAALYDGWACLGSANLDKLSLRVNYEINLGTAHQATVSEIMERLFLPDLAASEELTEPLPTRGEDRLLELLADQL